MKRISKTIDIHAYTDDNGKPVCTDQCKFSHPFSGCTYTRNNLSPGTSCPIWHGEGNGEWQQAMRKLLSHWLSDSNPDELRDFVASVRELLPPQEK